MDGFTQYLPLFTSVFGLFGFLIGAGWLSRGYLNNKFDEVHDNIDQKVNSLEKNIIQKLEYHERHDDERFGAIDRAVWDIRIRNAARDGLTFLKDSDAPRSATSTNL